MISISDTQGAIEFYTSVEKDMRVAHIVANRGIDPKEFKNKVEKTKSFGVHIISLSRILRALHASAIFCFITLGLANHSLGFSNNLTIILLIAGIALYLLTYGIFSKEIAINSISLAYNRSELRYLVEIVDGLKNLDDYLRNPAIIRKSNDPMLIINEEIHRLASMYNALIDEIGQDAAKNSHNYLAIKAEVKKLGAIARKLGYKYTKFEDELIRIRDGKKPKPFA